MLYATQITNTEITNVPDYSLMLENIFHFVLSIINTNEVYLPLLNLKLLYRLIIDKKERKLKKGSGFHLDIVLVCLSNVGCGLIGAPFMCAATVRSVAHVSSLTVMSSNHAPGDKPFIIEVKGIVTFGSGFVLIKFDTD